MKLFIIGVILFQFQYLIAQTLIDTNTFKTRPYSLHFQNTIVNQYKPGFSAKYSGINSLSAKEEKRISVCQSGISRW
jgi:high affinity Mn2+ porin